MSEPMFDPRRTAIMLRGYLIGQLHDVQQRILIQERFGQDAVPYPTVQSRLPSAVTLQDNLTKAAELVRQIHALSDAIDKSTEMDLKQWAQDVRQSLGL